MAYTLLRGSFVIRYPDLPRQGPEPDGDTIKFRPDTPMLVETLARRSGTPPDLNGRGISVRFEAIDTLETHFGEHHQELAGANAARDEMLARLGFTNIVYWDDLPNKVRSADQDEIRGHVLANGIDANGRLIAFVYAGEASQPDGSAIFVDEALVDASVNADLLRAGLAYPAFYATLPADLRTHLAAAARAAHTADPPMGIWPRATGDPNGPATVPDLAALEQLVIWPKLYRRVVPFLAAGYANFDAFDSWLRADPVNRDDELFLLDRLERGNIHDVITASGDQLQLTVWPEDFIISPDPAPPGAPTVPTPAAVGDILFVAALPNPAGADRGKEVVTLLNTTAAGIDLTGWAIADETGNRRSLSGLLDPGAVRQETLPGTQLGNKGDTLVLVDATDATVDQVSYTAQQAKSGRTICFGR